MKKKKKIIKFLGITFLIGIVILLFLKEKQTTTSPSISPTPTPAEDMRLLQVLPPAGKQQLIFTATAILFKFTKPINLYTANVNIEPQIEIKVETAKNDPATLKVRPVNQWQEGIPYKITILAGLTSDDSKKLEENIVYEIEFEFPDDVTIY